MNNQEDIFSRPRRNLVEDLRREEKNLDEGETEKTRGEEPTDAVRAEGSYPQEIMVNRIKVSPEGFVDLKIDTYGKVYKKGETIFLLVGESMKKLEAKFIETIEDGKNTKGGVTTIRVRLIKN